MKLLMQNKLAGVIALVFSLLFVPAVNAATSPLAIDLQALVSEGNALNTQLSGTALATDTLCSDLLSANQAANSYVDNIAAVNAGLAAPLTLDADVLQAVEDLSAVVVSLGSQALRLSTDLDTLSRTADQITIAEGLSAMLVLSGDIGEMADRIGEMADNILVMADNIGAMADRILITQQIQNDNIALTQASILTTQSNVIALVAVVDTAVYNTELSSLLSSGNLLSLDMNSTPLTAFSMAVQLASIEVDVDALKSQVLALNDTISLNAATNTLYVNQDSLVTLANLSVMTASLATALEGYSVAINGLAPITSTPTLTDSMGSMLNLSADIGLMANSILQMADLILAMSDNIGMEADQILLTQQMQSTNIAATQLAILAAQDASIGIIAAFSL